MSSEKDLGLSVNLPMCNFCVLANPTVTQHNTILQQFQKVTPGIKVTAKDKFIILGAPLGDAVKRDLLSSNIEELDKISNTVEHPDAHYGFDLLRNCFNLLELLYILKTSTCFAQKDLLKQHDDILKKVLSKVTNVCFTNNLFNQSDLPSSQCGLGVSSAELLALPAFLASAIGAREALEQHFGEEFEDKEINCALEEWFAVTGTLEAPDSEHQKNWSKVMYQKVFYQFVA